MDVRQPLRIFSTGVRSDRLEVGAGDNERISYLRFRVEGVPAGATITQAGLRLYCVNKSTLTGGVVHRVDSLEQWEPSDVTFQTPLPGPSTELFRFGPVFVNLEFVATFPLVGNQVITFSISTTAADGCAYSSSRGEHPPLLEVTYQA